MNYLSLTVVVKNEAPYIEEWLNFYRLQGVEHFYLFDNDSTDGTTEILKGQGDVTYRAWPGLSPQHPAYNYAINEYKNEAIWMVFVDLDEFCFSPTNRSLFQVIADYDKLTISGIAVRWYLYGSSGHLKYENRPVVDRFDHRSATVNAHCKTVARLSDAICVGANPHVFRFCCNVVNEKFEIMPEEYAVMEDQPADILRIAHFVTKSKEEFFERRKLPQACDGMFKDPNIMWESHDCNEVHCTMIQDNIKILKGLR